MNFVFIGSVTVNPPIKIPPNPKCSDNFCRQECRDIPNEGAKCYCRSGYQLQSDRVSCQGKITMNAHFRVFYLLLNIPRPPIQCWDATEQLRRAQSHIRWARNKDLLLPCFFFFSAFLGRGRGGGGGGADGDVVSTCSVLQLLWHPQSLQNSEVAKICDASTEIRKLSDILRFFITCDCPILLNDVISKIRARKVKH